MPVILSLALCLFSSRANGEIRKEERTNRREGQSPCPSESFRACTRKYHKGSGVEAPESVLGCQRVWRVGFNTFSPLPFKSTSL
jgi:hypothetical protein